MTPYSTTRHRTGSYTSEIYPWWNGPYTWPHIVDTFEVTGFGPNPGKMYEDPTPGEYKILERRLPLGIRKILAPKWGGGYSIADSYDGPVQDAPSLPSMEPYQYWPHPMAYNDDVYNNALSEFYEGLRETESNLALSIGEARESGRMLGVGKSIYGVLMTARKARRQAILNPSKTISEIWLSYKYGWGPFLNDIYNYTKWVWTLPAKGIPVRGRGYRRIRDVSYHKPYGWGGSPPFTLTSDEKWKCEVKVWLGVSNSELFNLTRITSLNPASIAWELVPLSFVVDWFYDIGGYLQNMEAAFGAGLTFKRGYVSEVCYKTGVGHYVEDYIVPGSYYRYLADYESRSKQVWKRRTKLTGFPFPRAPTLNLRLGWQRIISAAALLRVILLGKVR